MKVLKIGGLVISTKDLGEKPLIGIIVAFNKRGEGGKDFVHVLWPYRGICVEHTFDLILVSEMSTRLFE